MINKEEIVIRENKLSLYINDMMEYQAVDLVMEYGEKLEGCRYAVASVYSEEEVRNRYGEKLERFAPFIYLTSEEYKAIYEYKLNENKYAARYSRKHDAFGYDDELTAVFHETDPNDVETRLDPQEILMREEETAEMDSLLEKLAEALSKLTSTQRRRIQKYYTEGKTMQEIADEEGVNKASIHENILSAEKKLKKSFKNTHTF